MRLTLKVFCLALLTVALLAGSATSFASESTTVGKGTKQCVPEPGADCRGVVERWTVEYHGDLRKAKFTGAVLHGADFRGADLRGADFRGSKMPHADFTGAKLKGARFGPVKRTGKNTKQAGCTAANLYAGDWENCYLTNLSHANFTEASLNQTVFYYANLSYANFLESYSTGVDFAHANLSYAIFTSAQVYNADMYYANMTGTVAVSSGLPGSIYGGLWDSVWTGSEDCSTVTPSGTLNGYC